ncbi:MAG TPA: iron ABC transporter permease [Exilispira sp.]|nr:iron ABC transporter permease [Exilispira sp.]
MNLIKFKNFRLLLNSLAFILLTFIIFLLRLSSGNSIIPLKQIIYIFIGIFNDKNLNLMIDPTILIVIKSIRIPSFISAFIIGAVLSVCGLVMQIILKNPLAEPYTLGISSGASFGCSLAIFLSSFFSSSLNFVNDSPILAKNTSIILLKATPLFSIFFGILAAILIFLIAIKTKAYSSSSLIISGIIVNSFFTAAITILFYLLGQKVNLALSWMMGLIPLADKSWIPLSIIEFLLIIIYFSFHKEFDLISISGSSETIVGLNTAKFKQIFFLVSAIGVSLIVAQSGIIPFIGIIVPYILKLNPENHFKENLIYSIFFGGNFLVIIDILTYLIPSIFNSSIQLPIGAVSGFLGAPFFLFLLLKKRFN